MTPPADPLAAELIAVGTELLRFGRPDANGDWLVEQLLRLGIEVQARTAVADDTERIADVLRGAVGRAGLVVLTGGLGPTDDDRTREALALALDRPLERDAAELARLVERFARRRFPFSEAQARQAERPRGAEWIPNPLGSAPGLLVADGASLLAALPGVPAEMQAMFSTTLVSRLAGRSRHALRLRSLRTSGRPEAAVDDLLRDLYDAPGLSVTLLAGLAGVEVQLRAAGTDAAEAGSRLAAAEMEVRARCGDDVWGSDADTLAGAVGTLLLERGASVATAESCTAGLLAAALTELPGSSAWFRGGFVVYADDLKQRMAGVPAAVLERDGAVSEAVARELARAARERCEATFGLGVTGIAGPSGGSAAKPVGLVHVALAGAGFEEHRERLLSGDRAAVRGRTVSLALDLLRRRLLAEGGLAR